MFENNRVVPWTKSTSSLEWLLFLTKIAQRANYLGAVYSTLKTKSICIQQNSNFQYACKWMMHISISYITQSQYLREIKIQNLKFFKQQLITIWKLRKVDCITTSKSRLAYTHNTQFVTKIWVWIILKMLYQNKSTESYKNIAIVCERMHRYVMYCII